jgi:hypothetical protein
VIGDHFYPMRDHINLISRTVESDPRSDLKRRCGEIAGQRRSTVNIHGGWLGALMARLAGVNAITLGQQVFLDRDSYAEYESRTTPGEQITGHETVHTLQYSASGIWRFLNQYRRDYSDNRRAGMNQDEAYRNTSAEQQAYSIDERIKRFLTSHPDIQSALQAGVALTAEQINVVSAELPLVSYAVAVNDPRSWANHYRPVIGTDRGSWLYCVDGACQ